MTTRSFEPRVPVADTDIDASYHDTMAHCVLYQLQRTIKAHRLAVERGRQKRSRLAKFHPTRSIGEKCEADNMTLRKTVLGKSTDLTVIPLQMIAIRSRIFSISFLKVLQ